MRVLVAVASRHGATREIGEAIADVLVARGHEATVRDVEEVESTLGYDALVLGSAVYVGHWMPAARELADRLAPEVEHKDVFLFSSGLSTQPAAAANSPHEIADLVLRLGAHNHRSFRGKLDRSVLTFTERATIAGARAREGDHRNFDLIRAWAAEVADVLAEAPSFAEA